MRKVTYDNTKQLMQNDFSKETDLLKLQEAQRHFRDAYNYLAYFEDYGLTQDSIDRGFIVPIVDNAAKGYSPKDIHMQSNLDYKIKEVNDRLEELYKMKELAIINIFREEYYRDKSYDGMLPANSTQLENYSISQLEWLVEKEILQVRDCEGLAYEFHPDYLKNVILPQLEGEHKNMKKDIKTLEGWHKSPYDTITDYLQIGDRVDMEMYNYFFNILPPQTMQNRLFQVGGTTCEHQLNEDGKLMPTYITFTKDTEGNWKYEGECFNREWINRNPVLEVKRNIPKERMDKLLNNLVTIIKDSNKDEEQKKAQIESCGLTIGEKYSDITPTHTANILLNMLNSILSTCPDKNNAICTLIECEGDFSRAELISCGYGKEIAEIEKEAKEYWDYEIANDPAERAEQQEQDIYDEPNIEDDFDI